MKQNKNKKHLTNFAKIQNTKLFFRDNCNQSSVKTKTFEVYDTEEDALSARDPEDMDSVDIDLKSTTSSDVQVTESDTLTQVRNIFK